jgi:putative ABC transport system ATP-binding protein
LSILSLSQVSKVYKRGSVDIPALTDVSFEVGEGDFVSIVGRSGSGKSTLLNLIAGLDTASAGRIVFKDKHVTGMSRRDLALYRRFSIGMVFQSFNLIPHRTALENVALALIFGRSPRRERKVRAAHLLGLVGLQGRLDHRPGELSGGEAQRVAIARAMANNPAVLLLDEPTGNLDSATSREIMVLISRLNRAEGLTVLMVTHEQDIAGEVSTSTVHLKDGRVVD